MARKKLDRKTLPKWTEVLTVKEIWHLIDVPKTLVLKELKVIFVKQKENRVKYSKHEPCWDCRFIAKKLNCGV